MKEKIDFLTLVDMRSPAETKEDQNLDSSVYDGYENLKYNKKTRSFDRITSTSGGTSSTLETKKRYFISIMSESLIKRSVFLRFRKRLRVKFQTCEILSF